MASNFLIILGSALPLPSVNAEHITKPQFFTFVCTADHPDPDQLLADRLNAENLELQQRGNSATTEKLGVPADLIEQLDREGSALSLVPMNF